MSLLPDGTAEALAREIVQRLSFLFVSSGKQVLVAGGDNDNGGANGDPDNMDQTIYIIYLVTSILSLIGSSIMILSYWAFRELRDFPFSIIIWQTVCDFMFALKFFLTAVFQLSTNTDPQDDPDICLLQSVWAQFWGLGSVSWIGVLSVHIILQVLNPLANYKKFMILYHLYVWSASLITSIIIVASDSYGIAGDGTCWISEDSKWQLIFLLPLTGYMLVAIVAVVISLVQTRTIRAIDPNMHRQMKRLMLYVFVFIIFWITPYVHGFLVYFGYQSQIWDDLDATFVGSQGAANAIVWLTSPFFIVKVTNSALGTQLLYCCNRSSTKPQTEASKLLGKQGSFIDIMRKSIIEAAITGIHLALGDSDGSLDADLKTEDLQTENVKVTPKQFTVIEFCPKHFQAVRRIDSITNEDIKAAFPNEILDDYAKKQRDTEGRSGSVFFFSKEDLFIIKTIDEAEAVVLKCILARYLKHLKANPDSLLVRFYGLYQIKLGVGKKVFFVLMKNILPTSLETRRYDIKGSWVSRTAGEAHRLDPVGTLGMDSDIHREKRISLGPKRKTLVSIIQKDCNFLFTMNIIDYSLLVAIHDRTSSSSSAFPSSRSSFNSSSSSSSSSFDVSSRAHDPLEVELGPAFKMSSELGESITNDDLYRTVTLSAENIRNRFSTPDDSVWYFFGIIDCLSLYSCQKMSERCIKVYLRRLPAEGISAQPPEKYCSRFLRRISETIHE